MKRMLALLLVVTIAACARPQVTGFSLPHPDATIESIFVAAMRSPEQSGQMFGQIRSTEMTFLNAEISVPPNHKIGRIERSSGVANAGRYFAPLRAQTLPTVKALSQKITASKTNTQEPLLVFVHGYNNTLEDATFRLAQIQHDFELTNPALLFSWPSAGDPRGYVYDRDSVLFARSDFTRLLSDLNSTGQRRIMILAHSMGSQLVMESLRQLSIEGNKPALKAIESVVFMSPDIDPDLFKKQASEIGQLPQPFVIMTSQKDSVLTFSSILSGGRARLGGLKSADELGDLGVFILDFSRFDAGDSFGHMVPVSTPEAIIFLRKLSKGLVEAPAALSRYLLDESSKRTPNQ